MHMADSPSATTSATNTITILVNTRPKDVLLPAITYDQVVALAFSPPPQGENVLVTVTYSSGPEQNPEGTMTPGTRVKLKPRMVFNVSATDKS